TSTHPSRSHNPSARHPTSSPRSSHLYVSPPAHEPPAAPANLHSSVTHSQNTPHPAAQTESRRHPAPALSPALHAPCDDETDTASRDSTSSSRLPSPNA